MNNPSSRSHRTTTARRAWSGLLLCCAVFIGAACSSNGSETAAPATDDSSTASASEQAALVNFTGGDYPDVGTFCAAVVHLGTTIEASGDSDVEQLHWHAETILERMPDDAREETVGYFEAFAELSRLNAEHTDGSAQPEKLEVARRWIAEDIILVSALLTTDCSPVGPVRDDYEFNRRLQLLISNSLDLRDAFEATGDQIEDLNS